MKLSSTVACNLALCALLSAPVAATEIALSVQPAHDGVNVPVSAPVTLPADLAATAPEQIAVQVKPADGGPAVPGQVVAQADAALRVWWILPSAKAGQAQKWSATLSKGKPAADGFTWKDEPAKHLDLLLAGRPVIRYMYAYDTSTKESAHETYKVYTHVFNADGTDTITKGAGGKYTHHRGLFIGFNKTGYDDGKKNDWWHMGGVTMRHREFASKIAGPVLARSVAVIDWMDAAGKPVIIEERTTTVYRQPAPALMLLDFQSKLTAARSKVMLDGDPEHAGMHYRPHNDVETKATRYQFPVDKPDLKKVRDLPWAGECYTLKPKGDKYSVQHMNHPDNPKDTIHSAYRDYGRFGAFFKKEIEQGQSLTVLYRFWVVPGDMPAREQMQSKWQAFAEPPKVSVVE